LALGTNAQNTQDTSLTHAEQGITAQENTMDSTTVAAFEDILNQIVDVKRSELEKNKLIDEVIQ